MVFLLLQTRLHVTVCDDVGDAVHQTTEETKSRISAQCLQFGPVPDFHGEMDMENLVIRIFV